MSGCGCTAADHEALKAHDVWPTLRLVGYQPRFRDTGPDAELRDAPCGSTLARAFVLTDEERAAVREINRQNGLLFRTLVRDALAAVRA